MQKHAKSKDTVVGQDDEFAMLIVNLQSIQTDVVLIAP